MNGSNRLLLDVSSIQPLNLSARLSELTDYPHACLEQLVSKCFPQLYLSDISEQTADQVLEAEQQVKQIISACVRISADGLLCLLARAKQLECVGKYLCPAFPVDG